MELDRALEKLGKWGKWQILFYILICIVNTFPASWHMMAIVFVGAVPPYHCTVPRGSFVNETIPKDLVTGKLETCKMYKNKTFSNETQSCIYGFSYDETFGDTIVKDFDLTCGRSYFVETSQTVMVTGVMIGAMFFSIMSDKYGRKPIFLFSELAMVVVGVATAFSPNYYVFTALRFFAGMLQQGIILTGFVMACELFPANMRTFAGMALENFWAAGMCILAGFSYFVPNWRHFQLLISVPGAFCIILIWVLPESVPWLCANSKVSEAEKIIKRAAKFNGVTMPANILVGEGEEQSSKNDGEDKESSGCCRKSDPPPAQEVDQVARYTLLDVIRHHRLRLYAIIMCLLWFVNSLVYYGLSLSTATLAGDRHLNFFLSGLVEAPAYTASIFILEKFGRRWPLAIFHIVAGIALGLTVFIPKVTEGGTNLVPLIITLNMVGKFGITGSFGTVFLYAPEIFPTTLRNQAMGLSSLGGRLGNMLAPFSSFVAQRVWWLPGISFGILSIVVGLLTFLLPETLNRALPQTIEDIDNWAESSVATKQPYLQDDKSEEVELINQANEQQKSDPDDNSSKDNPPPYTTKAENAANDVIA